MKVAISTIKRGKVYGVLGIDTSVSRSEFVHKVITWANGYFKQSLSNFVAVESDLYSMVIVLDYNNDHEDPQVEMDI